VRFVRAGEEEQAPQVVFGVRVSRDEPVRVESLPQFSGLPMESVEVVIVLSGEDLPYGFTLLGLVEVQMTRAAELAVAAVRDARWPEGRYMADVVGNCGTGQYVATMAWGEAVSVQPRPPF